MRGLEALVLSGVVWLALLFGPAWAGTHEYLLGSLVGLAAAPWM